MKVNVENTVNTLFGYVLHPLKLPRLDFPLSRMNLYLLHMFSRDREVLNLVSLEELLFKRVSRIMGEKMPQRF